MSSVNKESKPSQMYFIYFGLVLVLANAAPSPKLSYEHFIDRARDVLDVYPLIDGHNDFPLSARENAQNQLSSFDMTDLSHAYPWNESYYSHTDINRLRQGKVGAQFWSAYVSCDSQYKDSVPKTFEQIDFVRRMADYYPDVFQFVTTSQGIRDAFSNGKIASLIGVEGGHSIGSSLATLRSMYTMGARYLTLTHSCTTPWGDNSELDKPEASPVHDGLSPFGELVVQEMNRLGMLVDLAHVSKATMLDALRVSQAPVIFSHSSAYALCNQTRNVQDDILLLVKANGGIVMVNFFNVYITCSANATVQDVADHIEHIRDVAGVDHIGIGSDYDGTPLQPTGLEDVSKFPNLFAELLSRGWTEEDLGKVAGENLLRVFQRVEEVRDQLAGVMPHEDWIPKEALAGHTDCMTDN